MIKRSSITNQPGIHGYYISGQFKVVEVIRESPGRWSVWARFTHFYRCCHVEETLSYAQAIRCAYKEIEKVEKSRIRTLTS